MNDSRPFHFDIVLNEFEKQTLHDALMLYSNTLKDNADTCSKTLNNSKELEISRTKSVAEKFDFDDFDELTF